MAASMGVKSRFAVLKVEDDDDSDSNEWAIKQKGPKQTQQAPSSKKNKKKKNKASQNNTESEQKLRSLAFSNNSNSTKSKSNRSGGHGDQPGSKQWHEWREHDEQFASEVFENDLKQALMLSKLDSQKKKETVKEDVPLLPAEGKTKKKKKDKAQATMSLEEFNKVNKDERSYNGDLLDEFVSESSTTHVGPTTPNKVPPTEPEFFSQITADAQKIIQKEKTQKEYQKQYLVENIRAQQYHKNLETKESEITFLRATMKKLEEELKTVKHRNKQLCYILGQAEMKDKADVLLQLEELTQIKDELTSQVSELTAELEKERSKTHTVKLELDKLKGGKHGSK